MEEYPDGVDDVDGYVSSFLLSLYNGLSALLITLAKRKLISDAELDALHSAMSKPLELPINSGNPLIAGLQSQLDAMHGEIRRFIQQGARSPGD